MNVRISYKQLESTPGMENVTRKKCEKLNKYFRGNLTLEWIFLVEKQNHIARVHLYGDHMKFHAEAVNDSIYTCIDEAVSKLERQVRKLKEEVKNHHIQGIKGVVRAA